MEECHPIHTIAVVAKCPIPGQSKTRLVSLLGDEGSARLAKAMLSDVLVGLLQVPELQTVRKILFYAPADQEGLNMMRNLLQELQIGEHDVVNEDVDANTNTNNGWMLLPMVSSVDLKSTHLGHMLTDILKRTRNLQGGKHGNVVFLGMDAPELPLEEIVTSITIRSPPKNDTDNIETNKNSNNYNEQQQQLQQPQHAFLCPANDGGYGMLCVPPQAPTEKVFQGVRWSDPLTALAQLKVLSDCNIPVRIGRMMHDIDEPHDVEALCQRLLLSQQNNLNASTREMDHEDSLLKSSSWSAKAQTSPCHHTVNALTELGLLNRGTRQQNVR